jgi:hypothetical protein
MGPFTNPPYIPAVATTPDDYLTFSFAFFYKIMPFLAGLAAVFYTTSVILVPERVFDSEIVSYVAF